MCGVCVCQSVCVCVCVQEIECIQTCVCVACVTLSLSHTSVSQYVCVCVCLQNFRMSVLKTDRNSLSQTTDKLARTHIEPKKNAVETDYARLDWKRQSEKDARRSHHKI